ncbi:MAG: hypothetical protein KTR14_09690 [Vampirovibrio sp.]|nr:hypothetical protein [Vampirovibrio sp.]
MIRQVYGHTVNYLPAGTRFSSNDDGLGDLRKRTQPHVDALRRLVEEHIHEPRRKALLDEADRVKAGLKQSRALCDSMRRRSHSPVVNAILDSTRARIARKMALVDNVIKKHSR